MFTSGAMCCTNNRQAFTHQIRPKLFIPAAKQIQKGEFPLLKEELKPYRWDGSLQRTLVPHLRRQSSGYLTEK